MTVFILGANIPSLPPLIGFCVIPRAYSVEMQFMCFTVRRRNQTNALLAVTCVRCTQPARRQKLTVYRMNKQVEILKSFRCSKSHCTWRQSVEFSRSVASDSATPWTAARQGLPVHHQLLEFTQTQFHWVGDAIPPPHPLLSPPPPALNLSQHQGLFIWVSSSHQVAKGNNSISFEILKEILLLLKEIISK